MREQDLHSVLWQKRNELSISDDVQHDWLDMQTMLDAQMPVATPPAATPGTSGLSGLSGFKLLSVLLATIGTATLIYFASHKGVTEKVSTKKDTTSVIVANKNEVATNSNTTNEADSLRGADSSAGASNTAAAASTNDKTIAKEPANAANGSAAINPAPAVNNKVAGANPTTTSNGLPGDKPGANGNPAIKENITAKPAPNGNVTVANVTRHSITGVPNSVNNKLVNKAGKPSGARSLSISHIPNKDLKNPANRFGSPHTGTITSTGSSARATISGNGLVRHGRNALPHTAGGSPNNILSRLRGSHSSRKGNNNPLTGKGKPGGNSMRVYIPVNNPPVSNPAPAAKNDTAQYPDLADAAQAMFVPDKYWPAPLSPALTDKFKDVQNGSPTVQNNNKTRNNKNSKLEFGILAGVNTDGSFTAKSQNANFYGSFPVDGFFGLFTTYYFNDKWGVNLSVRGLNPQTFSGTYNHSNDSKIDTLQTLNMSDSRKVYFVDVPLNLVFKPNPYLSLKAGPVFSLPVKQVNGISTFQTGKLKKDSVYYVKVNQTIKATTYTQSINVGLSAGASAQMGRFVFDAAYIRGLKGLTIGSGLGSYTANSNYFLLTIGFNLTK